MTNDDGRRRVATWTVMAIWLVTRVGLETQQDSSIIRWISRRPELVTPVTGWRQFLTPGVVQEGVYLFNQGHDPYDGDVFHQSPLLLYLFSFITTPTLVSLIYGLVECSCAWMVLKLFRRKWPTGGPTAAIVRLKKDRWMLSPDCQIQDWQLVACYLLSPLQVMTSLSKSTLVFTNLSVLLTLTAALKNQLALAIFSLSIATHLSVYPVLLLPSCIAIICEQRHGLSSKLYGQMRTVLMAIAAFIGHFLTLSFSMPFTIAKPVLLAQLDVNKHLSPNVGLHWYFSIEMFDHFRLFFNLVFQIHVAIYVAPLLLKFSRDRVFAFIVMNGIIATFKSYPSIGDVSFANVLALICYPELIIYLRHPLLTICLYGYALCLLPTFYHQWIELGSGNANFYYASTLVWAMGNGLMWIDMISGMLRRQFEIDLSREKGKDWCLDEEVETIVQK